ncbi:hypothetical protein OG21DRAFT_1485803 [Imleria badia]|nr:hypothetical protein OG21DRAFT_1485803 [Imleria badia]
MTELVPNRERDSLKSFAEAVWGNAQAFLKQDHTTGAEYIDMTEHPHAFKVLLGPAVRHQAKILVREEYRIALHELETNDTYRYGAYITGQPGIGKTLFLAYALVARLGQQRTVAWQDTTGRQFYVLFRDTATFYSLADPTPLYDYGPLWALSDSNAGVQSPAPIFYSPDDVRTIQTTSPKQSNWKAWSKYAGAVCYVMDIWSEEEIVDLAKLLNLDIERMTTLAKEWGGAPRSLLQFVRNDLTDEEIESMYTEPASMAVQKCRELLSALQANALPDDAPSQIYFCRPRKNAPPGMQRRLVGASVPTRTIRRFLGEALQVQDNVDKLEFFRALRQPASTRQAAGFIYENWFHTYFSVGRPIQCHWLQGLQGVSSLLLTGMKLIEGNWGAVKVEDPPYYWIAPVGFPGIDSALILHEAIYVFQVTISTSHKSPKGGMKKLRTHLPTDLKDLPWSVVFIGDHDNSIKSVANKWVDEGLTIGWSQVDPVAEDITYRVFHDESDLDGESESDGESDSNGESDPMVM